MKIDSRFKIQPVRSGDSRFTSLEAGFTLIEVLIVIVIISFLAGVAIYMSGDFFISNSFQSDVSALGVSLQRARSQAINNINESPHGVKITSDGDYVIFEGASYSTSINQETIKGNSNYTFNAVGNPTPAEPEVVFSQLSGDSSFDGDIIISSDYNTETISLNIEGRIDF